MVGDHWQWCDTWLAGWGAGDQVWAPWCTTVSVSPCLTRWSELRLRWVELSSRWCWRTGAVLCHSVSLLTPTITRHHTFSINSVNIISRMCCFNNNTNLSLPRWSEFWPTAYNQSDIMATMDKFKLELAFARNNNLMPFILVTSFSEVNNIIIQA